MPMKTIAWTSLLLAPVATADSGITCTTKTSRATCPAPDCRWNGRDCEKICFKYHLRYRETDGSEDMAGVTEEKQPTTAACQAKCKATAGCVHFSYWPEFTSCRSNSATAKPERDDRAFSGPTDCDEVCFSTSEKWMPLNTADTRQETDTPAECQQKCAANAKCKHFSWWLDKGCHLMDGTSASEPANQATSGPQKCTPPPTPAPLPTPPPMPAPTPAPRPGQTPAPTPKPTPLPTLAPTPAAAPEPAWDHPTPPFSAPPTFIPQVLPSGKGHKLGSCTDARTMQLHAGWLQPKGSTEYDSLHQALMIKHRGTATASSVKYTLGSLRCKTDCLGAYEAVALEVYEEDGICYARQLASKTVPVTDASYQQVSQFPMVNMAGATTSPVNAWSIAFTKAEPKEWVSHTMRLLVEADKDTWCADENPDPFKEAARQAIANQMSPKPAWVSPPQCTKLPKGSYVDHDYCNQRPEDALKKQGYLLQFSVLAEEGFDTGKLMQQVYSSNMASLTSLMESGMPAGAGNTDLTVKRVYTPGNRQVMDANADCSLESSPPNMPAAINQGRADAWRNIGMWSVFEQQHGSAAGGAFALGGLGLLAAAALVVRHRTSGSALDAEVEPMLE